MKPRILILALCALCALCTLASCHTTKPPEPEDISSPPPAQNEPVSPELQKVLDAMHFEKAPTLGPVYRQYWIDVDQGNYDRLWDSITKASQKQLAISLQNEIGQCRLRISSAKSYLDLPDLSEADRAEFTQELDDATSELNELQALNGDAKKYFIWFADTARKDRDHVKYLPEDQVVAWEYINENKGMLCIVTAGKDTSEVIFVKENGEWKYSTGAKADRMDPPEPKPAPPAQNEPTTPGLAEALDKMHFENAPTLGPIYHQFLVCAASKKYDECYDLLSAGAHDLLAKRLESEIARYQTIIKTNEEKLAAPGVTEAEKADLTKGLEYTKTRLAELQECNGDAKQFFAVSMDKISAGANAVELLSSEGTVVGEGINGDKGTLKFKREFGGESSRPFIKENGVWKIALMYTSEAPAPPNP